jgi:alkyl hydroperoxide reductase subunit AhpF
MEVRLDKQQLLQLLESIRPPEQGALSDEAFESVISAFCAGCPDPVQARWLLLDCLDPLSDEELVERALAMPPKT